MATAKGVRFATARLPTPGTGLDAEDRYAIGGTLLSANSISLPATDSARKQRAAIARIVWADSTHDDEQDRYTIAGVVQPIDAGSVFKHTFELTYTLTPSFSLGNSYDGAVEALLGSMIGGLTGAGFVMFETHDPGKGTGTTEVPINNTIDDHSGFKLFRDKGYTDGYGRFTVVGEPKHPQDRPRVGRNAPQRGPQSPEDNDTFISGDLDPDKDF